MNGICGNNEWPLWQPVIGLCGKQRMVFMANYERIALVVNITRITFVAYSRWTTLVACLSETLNKEL